MDRREFLRESTALISQDMYPGWKLGWDIYLSNSNGMNIPPNPARSINMLCDQNFFFFFISTCK